MSAEQLTHMWQDTLILTTRGTNGERDTGLGIKLYYEIAISNVGSLTANIEEGKGSSFFLRLKGAD